MKFKIINQLVKSNARKALDDITPSIEKPMIIEFKEATRSLEQNAKLWALLSDVSKQVDWHGSKLSSEDWKHVFSAALYGQKSVPNLDGNGFVVLGQHTSRMTVGQMRDLIELIHAFGAEHNIKWSGYDNY